MNRIDQGLIDQFERFSHWFQRLTGLDCFWLAKRSFDLALIFAFVSIYLTARVLPNVSSFISILVFLVLRLESECIATDYYEDSAGDTKNNVRVDPTYIRTRKLLTFLTFLAICAIQFDLAMQYYNSHDLTLLADAIGFLFGPYFMACTPLPPGNSKFSQLIKSLTAKLSPSINPV